MGRDNDIILPSSTGRSRKNQILSVRISSRVLPEMIATHIAALTRGEKKLPAVVSMARTKL